MESKKVPNNAANLLRQWQEELTELIHRVNKEHQLNAEALVVANNLKRQYVGMGLKPIYDIMHLHIRISARIDIALQVFFEYTEAGSNYSVITFSKIIETAGTLSRAACYFMAFHFSGLEKDIKMFYEYSQNFTNEECIQTVVDAMLFWDLIPNITTYNSLLCIARSDDEIAEIFRFISHSNLKPSIITFKNAIKNSSNFASAMNHYRISKIHDIEPHISTFILLLKKADTLEQILLLENLMQNEKIELVEDWNERLLAKKEMMLK